MGLFDLASPLLTWLNNQVLGFLPEGGRLLAWSAVGGVLSMWLYQLTSNQDKIAALKSQLKASQKQLSDYDDDDFSELFKLMRASMGLAFRRLGRTLGPALLASLPLVFILAWASNTFDSLAPAVGDQISYSLIPADHAENAQVTWETAAVGNAPETGSIAWPDAADPITLKDKDGLVLLTLPMSEPVPIVHRKRWWNSLIGNAAGYLPEQDTLDAVTLDLPTREYISTGPGWVRGWLFTFFVGVLVASLIVKVVFRIH